MSGIEGLAKEAYLAHSEAVKNIPLCGIRRVSKFHFDAGFKAGASALMSLPMTDRLTDEEKEQVRFAHKVAYGFMNRTNPVNAEVFKGQLLLLESIFGKDFFKEENI